MGGGEPFGMFTMVHAERKFHFECDVRTIITHDVFSLYLVASCVVASGVRRASRINYRVSCVVYRGVSLEPCTVSQISHYAS